MKGAMLSFLTLLTAVLCLTGSSLAGTYYVSTTGSDSNSGTLAAPFATIQHAASIVNPGDTVIVEDGTYTVPAGTQSLAQITRGGSAAGGYVTFKSQNKWGAKLSGQSNTTQNGFMLYQNPSYVKIQNFEIYGFNYAGIDLYNSIGSTNIEITGNKIHDIGRFCGSATQGISGINMDSHNLGGMDDTILIEGNIFYAIGNYNYRTGEEGCTTPNTRRYNHGVYLVGSNVTIRNNVFFNITDGWSLQLCNVGDNYITIVNNTFAYGNPDYDGQIVICPADQLHDSTISNNIFYQPTGTPLFNFQSGYTVSNIAVSNNVTTASAMIDTPISGITYTNNYTSQDPGLSNPSIDPTVANYQLTSTSFAIDKGLSLSGFNTDILGVIRPQGCCWDIGAYEYVSGGGDTTSPLPPTGLRLQ